jgi:hypothetical protein
MKVLFVLKIVGRIVVFDLMVAVRLKVFYLIDRRTMLSDQKPCVRTELFP